MATVVPPLSVKLRQFAHIEAENRPRFTEKPVVDILPQD